MTTKLPNSFQFRVIGHPGHTHTAKRLNDVRYSVKWARGWDRYLYEVDFDEDCDPAPCKPVIDTETVQQFVDEGGWIIVEEKSKSTLPDEFHFHTGLSGINCKATRDGDKYKVTWQSDWGDGHGLQLRDSLYNIEVLELNVKAGHWKIIEKKPLTAQQQRFIKEFNEQIAQLDSSIKIAEQTIEHHNRMIGNYKERQETLRQKIAKLESCL